MDHGQCEVARIREQIEQEIQEAGQELRRLKTGKARHQFISATVQRLNEHKNQLAQHIGLKQAIKERDNAYLRFMEGIK